MIRRGGTFTAYKQTNDLPLFMILGHGSEKIVPMEKRYTLPPNTYLVLLTTAGNTVSTAATAQYQSLFESREGIEWLHHPNEYASEIEDYLNRQNESEVVENIHLRIYNPNDKIPHITTDLTTVWNSTVSSKGCIPYHNANFYHSTNQKEYEFFTCIRFMKSGIYKIPPKHLFTENKLNFRALKAIQHSYEKTLRAHSQSHEPSLGNSHTFVGWYGSQAPSEYNGHFYLSHRDTHMSNEAMETYLHLMFSAMTDEMFRGSLIQMNKSRDMKIRVRPDNHHRDDAGHLHSYTGYEYETTLEYTLQQLIEMHGEGIYIFDGCRFVETLSGWNSTLKSCFYKLKAYLQKEIIKPYYHMAPENQAERVYFRQKFTQKVNTYLFNVIDLTTLSADIQQAYLHYHTIFPNSFDNLFQPMERVMEVLRLYHLNVSPTSPKHYNALRYQWDSLIELQKNNPEYQNMMLSRRVSDEQQTRGRPSAMDID
jgi:hypothetical protein